VAAKRTPYSPVRKSAFKKRRNRDISQQANSWFVGITDISTPRSPKLPDSRSTVRNLYFRDADFRGVILERTCTKQNVVQLFLVAGLQLALGLQILARVSFATK
jgi:hypothetical protein